MKHLINASIQVVPKSSSNNTYQLVDEAIAVIKKSGLKHIVTPMDTIIEGYYDDIMKVIKNAQKAVLRAGGDELLVNIKFHIRKDGDVSFEEKTSKYNALS